MLSFRGGVLAVDWQNPALRHDFGPALAELPGNAAIGLGPEPRTMPLRPMWAGVGVNTLALRGCVVGRAFRADGGPAAAAATAAARGVHRVRV